MKTIIVGSRNIVSIKIARQIIKDSGFIITEVVSGTAKGADTLGEEYAMANGIQIKTFKPDWNRYKKRAGILRNIEMGDYAGGLIALWDGKSIGSKHMIDYATKKELKVYVGIVTVIETDDTASFYNIKDIVDVLNNYQIKGWIGEHDIIIEDKKINISYYPGNKEIEKEIRRIIEG